MSMPIGDTGRVGPIQPHIPTTSVQKIEIGFPSYKRASESESAAHGVLRLPGDKVTVAGRKDLSQVTPEQFERINQKAMAFAKESTKGMFDIFGSQLKAAFKAQRQVLLLELYKGLAPLPEMSSALAGNSRVVVDEVALRKEIHTTDLATLKSWCKDPDKMAKAQKPDAKGRVPWTKTAHLSACRVPVKVAQTKVGHAARPQSSGTAARTTPVLQKIGANIDALNQMTKAARQADLNMVFDKKIDWNTQKQPFLFHETQVLLNRTEGGRRVTELDTNLRTTASSPRFMHLTKEWRDLQADLSDTTKKTLPVPLTREGRLQDLNDAKKLAVAVATAMVRSLYANDPKGTELRADKETRENAREAATQMMQKIAQYPAVWNQVKAVIDSESPTLLRTFIPTMDAKYRG